MGLPLKGPRLAIKSGDTLIQTAGTQALRFKTWFDDSKAGEVLNEQPSAMRGYLTDKSADAGNQDSVSMNETIDIRELEFKKHRLTGYQLLF